MTRRAGVLIFLGAACGLFAYLLSIAGVRLPAHRYRIEAVVPTALTLSPHADVREAGVRIGEVAAVRAHGPNTVVALDLDDDHAPVYRDARVRIGTKTLAGENYVKLDPGHPAAGKVSDGARLAIGHADESPQLDQIFSSFDARRRRDLKRALDGLGGGLGGHGAELNRFFETSAAAVREAPPVTGTLARSDAQTARLVDDFGRVMRALGERRAAIRLLVRRSKVAAEAVAARDAQLRSTLDELPGFLRQGRATATRLARFAPHATPVLRDLRVATEDLVPAMRDLRPSASAGRRVMRELRRFARAAAPMLSGLDPFARATERFAPPLEAVLRQANPPFAYLAPYWRDLGALIANGAAATQARDDGSHHGRAMLFTDNDVGAGPVGQGARSWNPYPAPGTAGGHPQPFRGDYPRLRADPPYREREP